MLSSKADRKDGLARFILLCMVLPFELKAKICCIVGILTYAVGLD